MIQFCRIETGITDREDLAAWAEVFNNHIDEMNDDKKGVGVWYNTLDYNKDMVNHKPYIRSSFIYDENKGNVWEIYSDQGAVAYGTEEANNLIQYSLKQWKRLIKKAASLENK